MENIMTLQSTLRGAKRVFAIPALILASACVTINVYFPAAEAAQAADTIIRKVYGDRAAENPDVPANAPKAPSGSALPGWSDLARASLDLFIPSAHAAANIDVSTPAIQALTARMQARQAELNPHYDSGAIGMTNKGNLSLRNIGAVSPTQRNAVKALVAAENEDRDALYREVAKANGHPEWENEVRAIFAKRWVANAPSGWWYEDPQGQWHQK